MPKSKRNKVITLSRIGKKGREKKEDLFALVRKYCDEYSSLYLFSVDNMRNQKMKDIRQLWRNSCFLYGKNKVMSLALGNTKEEEYKENLHQVAKYLKGDVGLMFTNEAKEEVVKWFNSYSEDDYGRAGNIASQTVVLPAGALDQNTYQHSMEPNLRKLGLPTKLVKGIIHLTEEYTVCEEGDTLTPEQCTILKLFYIKTMKFHLTLKFVWHSDSTFEELL